MPPLSQPERSPAEPVGAHRSWDEFPSGASEPPVGLSRRDFLKVASASLAASGLSGCLRRSQDHIVPYVDGPEGLIPGIAQHYASAVSRFGFGRGVLVESHEGRPTKIEGNFLHPESLGSTDAVTQAMIWDLYSPNRLTTPLRGDQPASWESFEAEWQAQLAAGTAAILTEPTASPSLVAALKEAKRRHPGLRWYQHTALPRFDRDGRQESFDFLAADVVFFAGSDCLLNHPAALRYTRAFSQKRTSAEGNRVYAIEATPSVTGVQADWRLPVTPARMTAILAAVYSTLSGNGPGSLNPQESAFVHALAADLHAHAPRALCVVGECMDSEARQWGEAINQSLGAVGTSIRYFAAIRSDGDPACDGDLLALTQALSSNAVHALLILGGNPAYTAANDTPFAESLAPLVWSAHLSVCANETTSRCHWKLPESHCLEAWGDLTAFDGTLSVVQPLVEPLHRSRSALEVVSLGNAKSGGYDLLRAFWADQRPEASQAEWTRWLRTGVIGSPPQHAVSFSGHPPASTTAEGVPGSWLILYPDPTIGDGAEAGNPWLQELAKPLTKLVWDNAALVSPSDARRYGISNGDMIALSTARASVTAAAWILPGQADGCIALSLGGGRQVSGISSGFNGYPLRPNGAAWFASGIECKRVEGTYALVSVQHEFEMESRDVIHFRTDHDADPASEETQSLYAEWPRGEYAWGMVIDLTACTGCNACVIACQAENNTPTVGKDQVSRGRDMHWLRIAEYLDGNPDDPRVIHQPLACMQCENAPCELVCPVGATVHSSEGLNEMVYNRCVGTRYCSNNCPYKVRRFNFLDYRDPDNSPENLQKNPNVTVRARGVMEKCTYCVQRINEARIGAEKADRPIRDGEILTACQQVCPARAITFGNIADPASAVSRKRQALGRYRLLEDQNTRPRTVYLPKLRREGLPLA